MRKFSFLAAGALFTITTFAQTPDFAWARDMKGTGTDEARDVAVDANGNVYVVGSFNSAVLTLGSTTLANAASATSDIFLVKYSRSGNVLWARRAGGPGEDFGISVTTDGGGNAVITGWFQSSSLNFGTSSVNNYTTTGTEDIFVAKYSGSGSLVWARAYGGAQPDYAHSVVTDGSDNVFICGDFLSLSVLFGNFGVVNSGDNDAFLTKINPSGTPLWAKRIGGGSHDHARDVSTDAAANVYVTGYYNSGAIQSFSPSLGNAGGYDIFYAKYDGAGNNLLAGSIGAGGDEYAYAVAAAASGSFVLMGSFESNSLQFGSVTLSNVSGGDIFYCRLSAAASVQWAQKSTGSQGFLRGDIAIDGSGDVYAAGSLNSAAITIGSLTATTPAGFDGFAVRLTASQGNPVWLRTTNAASSAEFYGIALNGGLVHAAGSYVNGLQLAQASFSSAGASDGIVTKLCVPPSGPVSVSSTTVCRGLQGTITANVSAGTSAVWYSSASGGNPIGSGNQFTAPPGTYYVAAKDTNAGCGTENANRIAGTIAHFPVTNPSLSITGATLTAHGPGTLTAWLNCANTTTLAVSGNTRVVTAAGQIAIIVRNQYGCMDTSACISFSYNPGDDTTEVTTGLITTQQARMNVFPNPARDELTITSSDNGDYLIFNCEGRVVHELKLTANLPCNLRTAAFATGIYFLRPRAPAAGSGQTIRFAVTH